MRVLQHADLVRISGAQVSYRHAVEHVINKVPPPYTETSGKQIKAYINHGRWIGECPYVDGGAMMLDLTEPYFICPSCGNWRDDGKWHEVVVPKNRKVIEELLLARFDATTQNWNPTETVKDLKRENKAMGV